MVNKIFLDTNIYVDSRYSFQNPRMKKLTEYITCNDISILQCSMLIGEVEKHIINDMSNATVEVNKVFKMKELAPIRYESKYEEKFRKLSKEELSDFVIMKFHDFLKMNNEEIFSLDGISVEEITNDYIKMNPPFEATKPKEFKDAIMIKALKKYQQELQKPIIIISNDSGFRKAFLGLEQFIVFENLDDYFKYIQDDIICERMEKYFEDNDDHETINNALSELIDEFSYEFDEREEFEVTNSKENEITYYFNYAELKNEDSVQVHITVDIELEIQCKYLDVSNSFYDKEEDEYIIRSYIYAKEIHNIKKEIVVNYSYESVGDGVEFTYDNLGDFDDDVIDLSTDDTLVVCLDETTVMPEEDKEWFENNAVKCCECGKLLGFSDSGNYHTYDGEPLCDNCAVQNEKGFICAGCGYKHPYSRMGNSGQFCVDCEDEYDI